MSGEHGVLSSGGPVTRLGRLVAAGRRDGLTPFVPRPRRQVPEWVLCAVTAGHGVARFGAGAVQPVPVPGLVLIPPRVPHWYGTEDGAVWSETWAVFTGPVFDALAQDPAVRGGTVRPLTGGPDVRRLRAVLGQACSGSVDSERQLLALAGWIVGAVPERRDVVSAPVRAAMGLLTAGRGSDLSMPEVAQAVGLGYDALRRAFTAEVGCAPLQFRARQRLAAAATLLRTTDLTLRAVARELGFHDEFHLSRRFRAAYGRSPSAYRAEQRGPDPLPAER